VIRIDGVSKRYGGTRVLGPVSLDVGARSTLALVGSSGSGKSTLLRAVVGLVTPDEGSIEVVGEVMTPVSAPRLRRRIGYVIQEGGLFPHLTARSNATLMARHLGWPGDRIASRVDELAALVHLRAAGSLSGAAQRRGAAAGVAHARVVSRSRRDAP
jgi:osmoprotectant transport system ATP-binding protein